MEINLALTEKARSSFLHFCVEALAPLGFKPARHHRILIRKLQAVADGRINRLMVWMPPGSAKSTYTSVLFPAWLMIRGRLAIIAASHTSGLAEAFSRKVQAIIRDNTQLLGYDVDREAVDLWNTTNRCEYKAAGVAQAIAGFRADIGIIDDPVKSRQDADSATFRTRSWDWFLADFRTRVKPGCPIVIVGTRWHEDDLQGRILTDQAGMWDVVRIRAECEEEDDPLGRDIGEMLWNDDAYGYGADIEKIKDEYELSGNTRDWASLYQQRPAPASGSIFKTNMIGTIPAPPAGISWVRAWDLAATKATGTRNPDWTVGVKIGMFMGRPIVGDVVRMRGGPQEVEQTIVATAARDGYACSISIPQDPGQAGKAQIQYLVSKLIGYTVHSSPETGDKSTRASPVASQVNVGNLSLVEGPWNKAFIDELTVFPSGTKDDQVDALSRAFAMVAGTATLEDKFKALAS